MFDLFGSTPQHNPANAARLRRLETKLDLILEHLEIEYVEGEGEGDLPADILELANQGNRIGAIKAYRKTFRAGLAESAQAVDTYLASRR